MSLFRYCFILLVVGYLISACATSGYGLLNPHSDMDKPYVIVAFGDSITLATRKPEEGKWTSLLQYQLSDALPHREIRVINSGVSGNTSREGLARIEKDVLNHAPNMVLVEFGGNDATQNPKRHVTLEEYRANLESILKAIHEETDAQVVLLTFPPVIEEWHSWGKDPFYIEQGGVDIYVENYRVATREFAKQHNLSLIDIDQALRVEIERTDIKSVILPDGIHLTAEGNKVLARVISQGLLDSTK